MPLEVKLESELNHAWVVHRAAHELAARATDAYEAARHKTARFLGASSDEEIIFVRGATEAINLVAQSWGRANLGPGDEIGPRYDPLLAKLIASGRTRTGALAGLDRALGATQTLGVTTNRDFLRAVLRWPDSPSGHPRARGRLRPSRLRNASTNCTNTASAPIL